MNTTVHVENTNPPPVDETPRVNDGQTTLVNNTVTTVHSEEVVRIQRQIGKIGKRFCKLNLEICVLDGVQSRKQIINVASDNFGFTHAFGNCRVDCLLHMPWMSVLHGTQEKTGTFLGNVGRTIRRETKATSSSAAGNSRRR
ncbi:hypothetical protein K0M31_008012 [Melipona bicolor]|uniref:Uncharacterized protein n=1 Tax=Melipona bicolor TaxID=60889 RepID=A0AA40KW96_9HYME|nr:hypothetical protein K0M31_008012 [Melipona bicolor]